MVRRFLEVTRLHRSRRTPLLAQNSRQGGWQPEWYGGELLRQPTEHIECQAAPASPTQACTTTENDGGRHPHRGRPQLPIDLMMVPPCQLHEAMFKVASLPEQPPANRNRLRTHSSSNTFIMNVIGSQCAQTYPHRRPPRVHPPLPHDAVRGNMFHAFQNMRAALNRLQWGTQH